MNGKLFSQMVFYMVGGFIIFIFGFIIIFNFSKTARIFEKPAIETVQETTSTIKVPIVNDETDQDENKTIKYTRSADAKESNTDYGEDVPKKSNSSASGVKVEILNYTGNIKIAEELKVSFDSAGFVTSIVNLKEDKNKKTEIIERNDKKLGIEVQKILKAGKIILSNDPKSKVDVTLSIGDDYKP